MRELQLKVRDDLLNGEIFYSVTEAKIVIEGWREHYNAIRPHSLLELQTAGTRRRAVADCAIRTCFDRYHVLGCKDRHALKFISDHFMGRGQLGRGTADMPPRAGCPKPDHPAECRAENFRDWS